MDRRTSFALDEATILKLRKLADIWKVSQAEVVRRAIERADTEAEAEITSRIERLQAYHSQGGLAADVAEAYLGEVAESRADWGRDR
jgi:hypothetical protein